MLLVDANRSMSVKKSIAISKITTLNVVCHKVRAYRYFLKLFYHQGAAFAKHRRLDLKIGDQW